MSHGPLWMRHGTCADGLCRPRAHARPDSPLSHCGAAEAELAAQRLQHSDWRDAPVAVSPLRRARETAAIVARSLGTAQLAPIDTFAEWRAPDCVLGVAAGHYPCDYLAWREQRAQHLDTTLPGGESLRAFADRAHHARTIAADLAEAHGAVVVISHRLLIGAVAALHTGISHPADIFNFARDFHLAPAHLWAPHHERQS